MWVEKFNGDDTHLRCKWCKGSRFWCREAGIRDHAAGPTHKTALQGALAFSLRPSGQSGAQEKVAEQAVGRREAMLNDPSVLVQFRHLHFLLSRGRPMTDFSASEEHLRSLGVPHVASMHGTDGSGWHMAEALSNVVVKRMQAVLYVGATRALPQTLWALHGP
jgi:hypothetical protein